MRNIHCVRRLKRVNVKIFQPLVTCLYISYIRQHTHTHRRTFPLSWIFMTLRAHVVNGKCMGCERARVNERIYAIREEEKTKAILVRLLQRQQQYDVHESYSLTQNHFSNEISILHEYLRTKTVGHCISIAYITKFSLCLALPHITYPVQFISCPYFCSCTYTNRF